MNWAAHSAACLRVAFASVLGMFLCTPAYALPADIALSQLHHTQWTEQNGAPSGISAIVQTRDGYMWMVSNGRLFRFDGVEFERINHSGASPLPAEKIYALYAPPSGGLWVSYLYGGATFIGDGTVRSYFVDEGLPRNSVVSFAQESTGQMWAGTTRGLLRLEAGRWSFVHDTWQIPQLGVLELILDRDGTLWVLTQPGLYFLRRGARHFEMGLQLPEELWNQVLIASPDGVACLVRNDLGITELHPPKAGTQVVPRWRAGGFGSKESFPYALVDRDSNFWVSISGHVTRLPMSRDDASAPSAHEASAPAPEHIRLAGEIAGPMLEDREGNIWVASSGGLDKFRASAFVKIPLAQTSYGTAALAAADDGSVWIRTYSGSLHRFEGGLERESVRTPTQPFGVLHRDHAGRLWVGGQGRSIYHRRGNRWIEWRAEDGPEGVSILAIASQPDGALWVSILRAGVYRVIDNRWTLWGGLAELPRDPATALALDFNGRLWLGYVDGRIAVVDRGRLMVYDAADGLSTGAVQVIAARGRNIWIGGEKGLNWFDGRRFHSVQGNQKHAFANVTGVVEKAHGDLWLNTSEGAALIQAGEVRKLVADPGHPVQFLLFNHLDGMPGAFGQLGPTTTVESTDGRIWMSTTNGVVTLAPRWPVRNPIVPNVYIKSITVDGARSGIEPSKPSTLQLSTNPHVLQISYTAPSFAIPERVNFKYRLEGSDIGWQDAGTRREAHFTKLPPGRYRFQVIASNDSGVWNETGASLAFVIPPTFIQSREFIVLCAAAISAALWLLFVLRMRQVKAQLLSRNEERLMERERIARELHDTFLQGVQGLMLRFQSATERIPEEEPARKLMEDALDRADRVLAEGRDKVADLRASVSLNLPEALMMVGNELSRDYTVSFQGAIEGATRELNPLVQEEALRIGAEALSNAFRHARATRIGMTIVFGRRRFEIRVVDDGSGFDVSSVKPGRWGLKGIRERAGKIRGKVNIASQPGAGTTVELHIPAGLAYRKAAGTRWNWRRGQGLANMEDPT